MQIELLVGSLSFVCLSLAACAPETETTPDVDAHETTEIVITEDAPTLTITDVQNGDIACYLIDDEGQSFMADFELCDDALIGETVTYTTEIATLMSPECEGDMDCTLTVSEDIILSVTPISPQQ